MRYYVVGVNGCGKTTLLAAIHQQTGYPVLHGTHVLMESLGIAGDYAALRAMDQAKILEAWGQVAFHIAEQHDGKDLLLDTHIMNLTRGKVIDRSGDWIAQYDALVLVNAPSKDILTRIEADNRDRSLFPNGLTAAQKLAMLADYQQQTGQLFASLAAHHHVPSVMLSNKQGGLHAAADTFLADRTLRTA